MDTRMDGGLVEQGDYAFGPFRLDPVRRVLTQDGAPVPLAARLFDTLLYLVENHGRLVEREELAQAVWPGRTVEDGNLAKAVSSLRTVLKGSGQTEAFIVTAPGRGYRFATRVTFQPLRPASSTSVATMGGVPPARRATDRAAPPDNRRRLLGMGGVAVLCLAALLTLAGPRRGPVAVAPAFAPPPRSVAVLPFSHADAADEQFADGVSEELINALGRVGALRVAGRMSSFSFKGRQAGIGEIARQLNVATVLEGSVRRDGKSLRVTAQLVDAVTGYQLWAQEYDRDRVDLLSVEGQIAEAVIASLRVVLAGNDTARLMLGGTADARAYDAYLAGMASLERTDEDTNARALAAFGEAIALDPHYALAYVQRARALAYKAATEPMPDMAAERAVLALARRDAEAAVAMAPDLGPAHAALALVLKLDLSSFARAQAELQRAMALSPGDVAILMDYAFLELDVGREDAALQAAEHAVALDPLTPKTYMATSEILGFARHFDEAFTQLRRAATLRPADHDGERIYRSIVQQLQGDAQAALQTCAGARDYYDLACLAWAQQRLGRQPEAEAALARLHTLLGDDGAYVYARIAAQWGRRDEALRWLRSAYDMRDAGLIALRIDPFLATLRTTPDYRRIEQALGFPP